MKLCVLKGTALRVVESDFPLSVVMSDFLKERSVLKAFFMSPVLYLCSMFNVCY